MKNRNIKYFEIIHKSLLKAIAIFLLLFIFNYIFSPNILLFLIKPLQQNLTTKYYLVYSALSEGFFVRINIAFCVSIVLIIPILSILIYNFCAPGLYRHEKNIIKFLIISIIVLFLSGCIFAYYYIIPMAIKFFSSFGNIETQTIYFQPRLIEYIEFICSIMIAFGISFQMPIGIFLLHITQILNYKNLQKFRRHLIVGIFIIAAIVTPPDVMSQIILAIMLLFLIEIAFFACKIYDKLDNRLSI